MCCVVVMMTTGLWIELGLEPRLLLAMTATDRPLFLSLAQSWFVKSVGGQALATAGKHSRRASDTWKNERE
jgi:hypothetical protein